MPRSLANSGCDKSVLSQSETSRLHRSLVSSFTLLLLRNRGGSPRQIIGARRPSSAGYEAAGFSKSKSITAIGASRQHLEGAFSRAFASPRRSLPRSYSLLSIMRAAPLGYRARQSRAVGNQIKSLLDPGTGWPFVVAHWAPVGSWRLWYVVLLLSKPKQP